MAQSGDEDGAERHLLSGVKPTWLGDYPMSPNDPSATSWLADEPVAVAGCRSAQVPPDRASE